MTAVICEACGKTPLYCYGTTAAGERYCMTCFEQYCAADYAVHVYKVQPWYRRWAYLAWDTIRWMVGR